MLHRYIVTEPETGELVKLLGVAFIQLLSELQYRRTQPYCYLDYSQPKSFHDESVPQHA